MSTNDVPGAVATNNDKLAMGCWAEHDDGSLILVESTENDRVIYSVFDMGTTPITEYRDALPTGDFNTQFKANEGGPEGDAWTWHDKTPFPWNLVIKEGARDGLRHASAEDLLSAAERVAKSRKLRGKGFDPSAHAHKLEKIGPQGRKIVSTIQKALDALKDLEEGE